jgi:hypothetical protein
VTTWKARLAVLAVFLLGAVSGGAAVHLYTIEVQRRIARDPSPVATILVLQLTRELDLSSQQEEQVRTIVHQVREETLRDHGFQAMIVPKVREILDRGEQRILPVLSEEQRQHFEALVAERRKLLEQMERKRDDER